MTPAVALTAATPARRPFGQIARGVRRSGLMTSLDADRSAGRGPWRIATTETTNSRPESGNYPG
jgi:hypothetical protein